MKITDITIDIYIDQWNRVERLEMIIYIYVIIDFQPGCQEKSMRKEQNFKQILQSAIAELYDKCSLVYKKTPNYF